METGMRWTEGVGGGRESGGGHDAGGSWRGEETDHGTGINEEGGWDGGVACRRGVRGNHRGM